MSTKRSEALQCLAEAKKCLQEYQQNLYRNQFNPSVDPVALIEEVGLSIRKIEEAELKICSVVFSLEEVIMRLMSDPDFMVDMIKIGGKIAERLM